MQRMPQMTYADWAMRWPQAAAELAALTHTGTPPPPTGHPTTEDYVQSALRLESAHCGVMLWRNNVGAFQSPGGSWVRFGLANDSPQLNARIKSADLVGIRRVLIGPEHIGHTLGQFVSRECKRADWRPGSDPKREQAQFAWAALVNQWGGDARIVTGPGSF